MGGEHTCRRCGALAGTPHRDGLGCPATAVTEADCLYDPLEHLAARPDLRPPWHRDDVKALLTRFYNRSDEEAEEVVDQWERTQRRRPTTTAAAAEVRPETTRATVALGRALASDLPATLAQAAIAAQLAALRAELPGLLRGALLDALGDDSHLDKLTGAVRDSSAALGSLPDRLSDAISNGIWSGMRRTR